MVYKSSKIRIGEKGPNNKRKAASEFNLFSKSLSDFWDETSLEGGIAIVFDSNDDDDDAKSDEIKKAKIDLKENVPVHRKGG